jgi:hypothetical protein
MLQIIALFLITETGVTPFFYVLYCLVELTSKQVLQIITLLRRAKCLTLFLEL